eukprot:TRINITY_DN774399_c0_g1_i1.p1 TRINITY_DN774399_c0_g1~~TRINITY_DN774399_c0_g1_i1.p1  ORF type:complete len:191 (-),score=23.24 TRINITY_DN774399_c0_g1_i1:42-614(-)
MDGNTIKILSEFFLVAINLFLHDTKVYPKFAFCREQKFRISTQTISQSTEEGIERYDYVFDVVNSIEKLIVKGMFKCMVLTRVVNGEQTHYLRISLRKDKLIRDLDSEEQEWDKFALMLCRLKANAPIVSAFNPSTSFTVKMITEPLDKTEDDDIWEMDGTKEVIEPSEISSWEEHFNGIGYVNIGVGKF